MQSTFSKGLDAIFWITLFLFISTGWHQSAETRKLIDSANSHIVEESTQAQGALRKSIQQMGRNQKLLNDQITRLIEYQQAKTKVKNQDQKDIENPTSTSPINAPHEEAPRETEIKGKEERLAAYTDSDLKDLKRGIYKEKLMRFESSLTDANLEELKLQTQVLLERFLRDQIIESMRNSALVEMQTENETSKELQRIDEMEKELNERENGLPAPVR